MRFTIRGVLPLVAVLTGARIAEAEPVLRLSDVVAAAVRQSPELVRARIDVDTARATLLRAQGSEDTVIGAQLTGQAAHISDSDPQDMLGDTNGDQRTATLELSAARRFSTGGGIELNVSGARITQEGTVLDADRMAQNFASKQFTASAALTLNQPLLRGAGSAAFEAPIRQAEQQRDAAALNQEARARDLVVSLAQAYWQVAFAWRQLEVRKTSLDLAQKQLAYTEGAIRAEKVPRSEVLPVQQAIATRKQDVIAAEQELDERSLALRQLGGLEIEPDAITVTTEVLPAKVEATALDSAAVVRAAFERSAELAALAASRHAAEIGAAAADNAAKSRLDLDVTGGPTAAARIPSTALSNAVDSPSYQVTASLTFQRTIERSAERGAQVAARAQLLAAKASEREARARVAVRATRAVQRAKAALASVALGDEAVSLAEQNVTAEQRRYELGKSTNFEVLRRQDELEQARLRQAAAVADYLSARADLDGLSGAILARYGIVMP